GERLQRDDAENADREDQHGHQGFEQGGAPLQSRGFAHGHRLTSLAAVTFGSHSTTCPPRLTWRRRSRVFSGGSTVAGRSRSTRSIGALASTFAVRRPRPSKLIRVAPPGVTASVTSEVPSPAALRCSSSPVAATRTTQLAAGTASRTNSTAVLRFSASARAS